MAFPPHSFSRLLGRGRAVWRDLLAEHDEWLAGGPLVWWKRGVRFWVFVGRSFVRNRCPARASALAYTSLLALVPLLAVAVSVSTSLLKDKGNQPIEQLMDKFVQYVAPALDLEVKGDGGGRKEVVEKISDFIRNINTRALGVTGAVALLFVAVSLLRTIETTFNDIWGVLRGRGWVRSIVYYWAAITLGPLLAVAAMALTGGSRFTAAQAFIERTPLVGGLAFKAMPMVLLTLGLTAFYGLMPNTRVRWSAALVGGLVGGLLSQLNNLASALYFSNVATYKDIYGGLSVLPLFLLGLFISWLIVLLGAQVAYAWQHRESHTQERLAETIHPRGREFIAVRLMTLIAARFARGQPPYSTAQLAHAVGAPARLCQQLITVLAGARLLVEAGHDEPAWTPARPPGRISVHDVLHALRVSAGQELDTKEDEWRDAIHQTLRQVQAAEEEMAGKVTLAELAQASADPEGDAGAGEAAEPESK